MAHFQGGRDQADEGEGDQTHKPFVLVEHGVRGTRITAINSAAQQSGAHVGQMLTDARAACPLIRVDQAACHRRKQLHLVQRRARLCVPRKQTCPCD